VREIIEYRFRVPSAAVFTLYSYSKALEYRFRVPSAGSLIASATLAHDATFYLWAPKRQQKVSDRMQSREMFEDATPIPVGFLDARSLIVLDGDS
jgi:hypothetical protein